MEKNNEISITGVLMEIKSELNLQNKILNQIMKFIKERLDIEKDASKNAHGLMGDLSQMMGGQG